MTKSFFLLILILISSNRSFAEEELPEIVTKEGRFKVDRVDTTEPIKIPRSVNRKPTVEVKLPKVAKSKTPIPCDKSQNLREINRRAKCLKISPRGTVEINRLFKGYFTFDRKPHLVTVVCGSKRNPRRRVTYEYSLNSEDKAQTLSSSDGLQIKMDYLNEHCFDVTTVDSSLETNSTDLFISVPTHPAAPAQ